MFESALNEFKSELRKEHTCNGLVAQKTYFYIDIDGYIMNDLGKYFASSQIEYGNCFTSRKCAEEYAVRLGKLLSGRKDRVLQ
jgi:hypothetical protein